MGPHQSLTFAAFFQVLNRRTLLQRFAGGGLATFGIGATLSGEAAGAQPASPTPLEGAAAEVLWDSWGVPHIFAEDAPGLFFGFGWAQAHAHGDLLLRLYAEARGRSAEFYGSDGLAFDQLVRTMGLPQRGERWYGEQPDAFRANIDAFAAGINA